MDADPNQRHSAPSSSNISQPSRFPPFTRDSFGRPPPPERTTSMASAAIVSPSAPYQSHSLPGYGTGYHSGPSSGPGGPGMLSPAESRRTSDGNDSKPRQSLPSIQEVIGHKPSPYGSSSLPSPFSSSGPRSLADSGHDGQPSPRTLQPAPTFPRSEQVPAFSEHARSAHTTRPPPPPPLNTMHGPHGPSPNEPQANGAFPHPPHFSHVTYQSGQLPPGQLPLSAYALSPRQPIPPPSSSPYDGQRAYPDHADHSHLRNGYEGTVNRHFDHFETWDHAETIAKIGSASRTLLNFSESYLPVAREEHGNNAPISSRLPTEREVNEMAKTAEWLKNLVETMRAFTQQANERAREERGAMEDDDISMHSEGPRSLYGLSDVKKRRGRAAPPGRCHSCNRIDTPEWRRGPDGARTLCNACGLHYAKLERKRLNEQRSGAGPPPGPGPGRKV